MFDAFADPMPLVEFGAWRYRRLADGGLAYTAPDLCPSGHELRPYRVSLHWHSGRRRMMVCCATCYDTDPQTGMFLPAEPPWMARFDELVETGRKRAAMAFLNTALPPPPR